MTKTITLSATALGVLTAWALAWGVNDNEGTAPGAGNFEGRHWGGHRGGRVDRMARHLDLSDEQRAEIEAIFATAREQGEQLRGELATLRENLGAMIRSDGYYEDQVRIQVESKSPVFVELTVLGIRTMNDVYQVLTPEQRVKADEMLARGRGRGFGRGFGPGGF